MYLLDTDICIYAIKKKTDILLNNIREKSKKGIYISALTVAELEYGIENSTKIEANRVALLKFLSLFSILSFSDRDAYHYGVLRADLKRRGKVIGPIDMLLAAQAISNGFLLVTNNNKEFARVRNLQLEHWL